MMYKRATMELRQCSKSDLDMTALRSLNKNDVSGSEGIGLFAGRFHILAMKILDRSKIPAPKVNPRKLDIAILARKSAMAKAISGFWSMLTVIAVTSLVFVPVLLVVESQKPGKQAKAITETVVKLMTFVH